MSAQPNPDSPRSQEDIDFRNDYAATRIRWLYDAVTTKPIGYMPTEGEVMSWMRTVAQVLPILMVRLDDAAKLIAADRAAVDYLSEVEAVLALPIEGGHSLRLVDPEAVYGGES